MSLLKPPESKASQKLRLEEERVQKRLAELQGQREELAEAARVARQRKEDEENAKKADRADFWQGMNEIRRGGLTDPYGHTGKDMDLLPHTAEYLGISGLSAHSLAGKVMNGGGFVGPGEVLTTVDQAGKGLIKKVADTIHDNTHERLNGLFGPKKDTKRPQGEEIASNDAPGTTPPGTPPKGRAIKGKNSPTVA